MILGSGVLGSNPIAGGGSLIATNVVVPPYTDWVTFDPITKRIILWVPTATIPAIYAKWLIWAALPENVGYDVAFRTVGGDLVGNDVNIDIYYFLMNDWLVRPMEADHTCVLVGYLVVDGGIGSQFVHTLGSYNVLINLIVPASALVVNSGGSGSVLNVSEIVDAVWAAPVSVMTDTTTIGGFIHKLILTVPKFLGLK
jgi:hypothetical protein